MASSGVKHDKMDVIPPERSIQTYVSEQRHYVVPWSTLIERTNASERCSEKVRFSRKIPEVK